MHLKAWVDSNLATVTSIRPIIIELAKVIQLSKSLVITLLQMDKMFKSRTILTAWAVIIWFRFFDLFTGSLRYNFMAKTNNLVDVQISFEKINQLFFDLLNYFLAFSLFLAYHFQNLKIDLQNKKLNFN